MPFNSVLVVSAATVSAGVWQELACLPERLRNEQLLDLVICFPLQQLGRCIMYIWTSLCVYTHPINSYYDDSDSDSDSD